jgi:UDP-glucose 4-epimerase
MARYLITGIAGFLGSWLARDLVARGESVRGIDNLCSGSLENLAGIETRVEFLHADLRDPQALEMACQDVDFIFHLAAIDSIQQSIDDPRETSSVNVDGTLGLLAAAQKATVKRIVFASSAAVYGEQPTTPIREDAVPCRLSPFAIQKLSCEQYLASANLLTGIETVSLRCFNLFGPRQSARSTYAGVIAQLTDRMLRDAEGGPVLHGEGDQTRDFLFIADAVRAFVLAMHAPAEMVSGKTFNIGCGTGRSIRLAFEAIACLTNYSGTPRFVQARPLDIAASVASIDAARDAFGFEPMTSFADGLNQTVRWFREHSAAAADPPLLDPSPASRRLLPATAGLPGIVLERCVDAQALTDALRNDAFELFYQPILDLERSRIVGVEALLRWRFGKRILTPDHFIQLAEEKGLTPAIGAWVLDRACSEVAEFQRNLFPDLRLAVNISPLQLEQASLLRLVESALTRSGLTHESLHLEITERTLVRDCASAQANLQQLRKRGVRIALDDFGTGYSNMNYLYRFPIDCIKIDQSFVQHKGHARILDGIVAFAQTLGVRTVAEGVESPRQLAHVKAAGCDEAQGFYIARPVAASQIVQSLLYFVEPPSSGGPLHRQPSPAKLPAAEPYVAALQG